jgi:hypothetical protein
MRSFIFDPFKYYYNVQIRGGGDEEEEVEEEEEEEVKEEEGKVEI